MWTEAPDSVCVCVCVHVCVHACMRTCMCACVFLCICVSACICIPGDMEEGVGGWNIWQLDALTKEDKCEQRHQAWGQPCVAASEERRAHSTEHWLSVDEARSCARRCSQQVEGSTPSPAVSLSLSCFWTLNQNSHTRFSSQERLTVSSKKPKVKHTQNTEYPWIKIKIPICRQS